jgi:hypothetical protein
MKLGRLVWVMLVCTLVSLPSVASAQETTLSGTVRDNTGGVLPGVTVTATNEAQGTTFVGVTDDQGIYRIQVRPGVFRVTGELSGFTTVVRPGVEILLGRQIALNLDMTVSGVQETVTVTGEAPLIDTTTSSIGSNIDPRQMQDIPLNGRNWMDLTLLAPGSRSNASSEVPQDRQGFFQVSVDGQQQTLTVCCSQNQPRYSRDSIAEFVISTNRFDATQGRTMGMLVSAVTKSGTNTPSGTFAGYFRDDRLNAEDFIQERVIPYSDQQLSGTFGGPIVRDRIHFFANWEYEREPSTITFNSRYPSFNIDLPGTRTESKGGVKGDFQFNPQNRLAVRWNKYDNLIPHQTTGGAALHPSTSAENNRHANQIFGVYTQVLSGSSVNEVRVGLNENYFTLEPVATWGSSIPSRIPVILEGITEGRRLPPAVPRLNFTGYSLGSATNTPQRTGERNYQFRDDFTTSWNWRGRHDVKFGGEFIRYTMPQSWSNIGTGQYTLNAAPPANIEQLIPVWNDASTWNLNALSPLIRDFTVSIGDFSYTLKRQIYAAWFQDDWRIGDRLTANLGVRWDVDRGSHGEWIQFEPWLSGTRPTELDNVAPRLGFAYQATDRTVIRGGYGIFFTELEDDALHQSHILNEHMGITVVNDGRPDFGSNPFNGPTPTYEQLLQQACSSPAQAANFAAWRARGFTGAAPCFQRAVTIEIPFGAHDTSYSHMASVGVQRQLGTVMAIESNFVFTGGRKEERRFNANLAYDPATGANYPFQDKTRQPFPEWSTVLAEVMDGRSNYYGWENSFTKRFSNRWQASATYSLSWYKDTGGIGAPSPYDVVLRPNDDIRTELVPIGFPLQPDVTQDYQLGAEDQRHRATLNGIWEIGMGFQLSGLYFFGSGQRFATSWGGDLRNAGQGASTGRLTTPQFQATGGPAIWPRSDIVGDPIHRVDVRVTKRQRIVGRATIDGIIEVFNLFNHENYGSYTTQRSNAAYGQPSFNPNVAFQPRIVQLGFRLAF